MFRTPYVAILASSAVTLLLTLFHTFASALTLSTISRLIVYAATCAALPVLRRKQGTTETTFLAPAGLIVSVP